MRLDVNQEKYAEEIRFWREEIDYYVRWYRGECKELYGVYLPRHRVTRFSDERQNALETWINADKWRYCNRLWVEPTYFSGKKVLEIGPGPLGLARFFAGASVHGIDPLVSVYREAGYPVDGHGVEYIQSFAEKMPFGDQEFDAVISVNAIDHVDSFEESISEAERVVTDDGELRIEVHYHKKTVTEPNVLDDEIVMSAFKKFDMKKIADSPSTVFYPPGTHPTSDRFCVWSNKDYIYRNVDNHR